jgi:hypothetical protein
MWLEWTKSRFDVSSYYGKMGVNAIYWPGLVLAYGAACRDFLKL